MKGSSQSQPRSRGTKSLATRKAKPSGLTRAGDWWNARQAGARLPEHALPVDQFSGDLLCPLCGEPVEVRIERTEFGAEPVGACAQCNTLVDIEL